jgi:hypothetical protein
MNTGDNGLEQDLAIEIEISSQILGEGLLDNPAIIAAIALAVRDAEVRAARATGNRYGKYAQRPKPRVVPNQRVF